MADEEREILLVGKLELRIALADTDQKLEAILNTYLPALLLKLASNIRVRNKVIEICQHVNTRTKSSAITLPVATLYKQFKENDNALVRHFDMLYIQRGIDRIPVSDRVILLRQLLKDVSQFQYDKQAPSLFQLLLQLLPLWDLPERGSQEDSTLRTDLGLLQDSATHLASTLVKFLLFETNGRSQGLHQRDVDFFDFTKEHAAWEQQRIVQVKVSAAKLLASGAFTPAERMLAAVVLSVDANATLSNIGDAMFKQSDFNLEDPSTISELFRLYWNSRPKMQIRILTLLSKSKEASSRTVDILRILDSQLFSSDGIQPAGLEGAKLRAQIFRFVAWVVRIGQQELLLTIAPKAVRSLKEFIESQGWPSSTDSGVSLSQLELDLRGQAYETIGLLLPMVNTAPGLEMVKWLFTALRCDNSSNQIFVSIEQALGKLINRLAQKLDSDSMDALRPLLLWNMQAEVGQPDDDFGYTTKRSVRYATVRFANRCLPFSDVDGRWIDVMAVGAGSGDRSELLEEGQKGLDPYWYRMLSPLNDAIGTSADTKDQYRLPALNKIIAAFFDHPRRAAQLRDPSGRFSHALAPTITFLRNLLVSDALSASARDQLTLQPDWDRSVDVLIATDRAARSAVQSSLRSMDSLVPTVLIEAAFDGLPTKSSRITEHLADFSALCSDKILAKFTNYTDRLQEAVLSTNQAMQANSTKVLGILLSHPSFPLSDRQERLSTLLRTISSWNTAIGQDAVKTNGYILLFVMSESKLLLRRRPVTDPEMLKDFVAKLYEILQDGRDQSLRDSAAKAVGQLSLCGTASSDFFSGKDFVETLVVDARKEREEAIAALGRHIHHLLLSKSDSVKKALERVYALHDIRKPETQFAVGAALSVALGGWLSNATMAEFDVDAEPPASEPDRKFFLEVMDKLIQDCKASKPSLKKASAIWLLSIIQYCRECDVVQSRLRECQAVFSRLLTDRDEVVQETGSRGLGLVFEMGDAEMRDDLVRDLVQSFTANVVKRGGSVEEDTELFEPGALPTGDGSVTTYKDIMNLAAEVGEPSLVYRFMNLAANNAIWSSRAAFGRFGLSNVLADSSYLAQNKKFYPKLYRYRFDPNPNVQRAMNDIWNAVVKDSGAVLNENFRIILEDLLKSIVGKEWRVRQASCDALADLLQGRDVDRYEQNLDEIWSLSFKVMDDIKETVRAAAMKLCRTLTNLLIRNLEVGDGTSARAQKMLKHALPFLRDQLDSGAPAEVRAYATITLIDVLKKSPPRSIRSYAPTVMETLLGSLSSLEDANVNYLYLKAEEIGVNVAEIDELRISSMNTSPLTEAIERCLECFDVSTIEEAMMRLESTIKGAIGLPSKIGCSKVLISLTVRHNPVFRPYANRFMRLMRKYLLDRNESVSVAHSMTLGYLARLATDSELEETARHAKKLYFTAEESSHRAVSGEILHAISKIANDRFMGVATALLPLAFIGRNDDLEQVRESFDKTWKDNVGGSRAVVLYFPEIISLIVENYDSPQWAIQHTTSLATAELINSFNGPMDQKQTLAVWNVLEKGLSGKTWEGKEKVLNTLSKFRDLSGSRWDELWPQARKIVLREARRQNAAYRPHGIETAGDFVMATKDISFVLEVVAILQGVADDLANEDTKVDDMMEVDGGETGKHVSPSLLRASVNTWLKAMIGMSRLKHTIPPMNDLPGKIIIEKTLGSDVRDVRLALYAGMKALCEDIAKQDSGTRDGTHRAVRSLVLLVLKAGPAAQREAENEATRTRRAEAATAYVQAFGGVLEVVELIRAWKDSERSRSVRQILEKSLEQGRASHEDS